MFFPRVLKSIYNNSSRLSKIHTLSCLRSKDTLSEDIKELLSDESEYNKLADHYFHIGEGHRCLIIQPHVKWGPRKLEISPDEQLSEAIALINTLPSWAVEDTITVPLDTLERKALFKSGNMEKIKNIIHSNSGISAVFVNKSVVGKTTLSILEENFSKPILDRYKIIMQILKTHATSKHAKLQVALAELQFIQRKAEQDLIFRAYSPESLKLMFQEREQKIKKAINKLRSQRNLLRNKRKKMDFPIVAVVGYTNSGKTSIIKALTGEASLQPKDQLFATLDVTVHSGYLPSGLEVLYVDTVGFISDIPTNLIECFVATLEDALLADIILHVEDLSSRSYEYKCKHVLQTLKDLEKQTESSDVLSKCISIANKCDMLNPDIKIKEGSLLVSAKKEIGLEELKVKLENTILEVTGRHRITIKVSNGGEEIRWLYKNSTVLDEFPDETDPQSVFANVIITHANLEKFKHYFI